MSNITCLKSEVLSITDKFSARLYGFFSDRVYLYVHGRYGSNEEAVEFAKTACIKGYQVLAFDLPNRADCTPWEAVPILREAMNYAKLRWSSISLYAVSIGAWFSMIAFGGDVLQNCLFVSPVLDMKALIENMIRWAGVSENELKQQKIIQTDFGETLNYKYYRYACENPIGTWNLPTKILYAENDNLTHIETVKNFCDKNGCGLTVFENGEHWFHTEEQLLFLRKWESECI